MRVRLHDMMYDGANKLNAHCPSHQRKSNDLFSSENTSITVTNDGDSRYKDTSDGATHGYNLTKSFFSHGTCFSCSYVSFFLATLLPAPSRRV